MGSSLTACTSYNGSFCSYYKPPYSLIFFLSHNNLLTTFENDYYECTRDCSHYSLLPVFYSIPFIYSLIGPSLFTHLLAHPKPGEGRVLSRTRIRDSYPWLRPETYEILDSLIKLNNRVLISLSYFPLDITFTLYSHWYTIFAFPSGSCR